MKLSINIKIKLAVYVLLVGAGCGSAFSASADYYSESIVLSTNLLSGKSDVAQITTFKATATVPAGTAVYASYSQDGTDWRDSVGVEGGWDVLSAGANSIDIRVLDWTTANFYYKIKFTNDDQTATATISEVEVEYSDTYTAYTPSWDGGYYIEGSMVSTDLLDGAGRGITGGDHFGYSISSLPTDTHIYAQFSTDSTNWYSSDGTLWGEDELSVGNHTSLDTALSLSELGWVGETSFYYKLNITATADNTPIITEAGLLEFVATIVSGGSATTINTSQTDKLTDGLVLMQSFDGNHMDWSQSTAEARDQSGQGNHGDVVGATAVAGKIGQALDFDGENQTLVDADATDNMDNFTYCVWVNPDSLTNTDSDERIYLLDKSVQITFNNSGQLRLWIPTSDIYPVTYSSVNLTVGNWQHICGIFYGIGTNPKIFLDNSDVSTSSVAGSGTLSDDSGDTLRIGADEANNCFGNFDGQIDEVRIYNRALSDDEIGDLYNMGKVIFRK